MKGRDRVVYDVLTEIHIDKCHLWYISNARKSIDKSILITCLFND